ncbi:MAG: hypothetical protein DBX59_03105 [Bacillota bacterium]|nr:MAG: hypothetical protein DBX59_03105 [Bacillota bacterium]
MRTKIEKMWYNMSAGKSEIQKNSGKFYLQEKRKQSFLIVKRGEIPSIFLTVFCKGFESGREKVRF